MFFGYNNENIRYTGRWSEYNNAMTAGATGSYIELAYTGRDAVLKFDRKIFNHIRLYISVDGGAMTETVADEAVRVRGNDGTHTVKIILKSVIEIEERWFPPLTAALVFYGFEADGIAALQPDGRGIIEFFGDSITEGVATDPEAAVMKDWFADCVYRNDVTATYGWLTAEKLNMRPVIAGYGCLGVTRGGNGNVPPAEHSYAFCFDGAETDYTPEIIVLNQGANDRAGTAEAYIAAYGRLFKAVREKNPKSRVFVLSAFCGVFPDELRKLVECYNKTENDSFVFIDSAGWVPAEPLHPLRDGHKLIAENLSSIIKRKY